MAAFEHWMALYQSAILETDQTRLPEKILAASAAITAQARKHDLDADEQQALADAMSGLQVLQNERT
jgi:hypothetical protein